jgi:hypothetical protein
MTYEVIILGHLHMPLYFIGTFTEYSCNKDIFQHRFLIYCDCKIMGSKLGGQSPNMGILPVRNT